MLRLRITKSVMLATLLIALPGHGADLARASDAAFRKTISDLDSIEAGEGVGAAAEEISQTREWIADGQSLLREGRFKKAAVLAERLPMQLELIRVLVVSAEAIKKATGIEREILEMERELRVLEARHRRLTLARDGGVMTGAFPPATGRKK